MSDRSYIIAEAGVNHNGSLARAREMVHAAAEAGADAVKFQTFKAEDLVVESAEKADYQVQSTGSEESQLEMLRKLELTNDEFCELQGVCERNGVEFISSPFDLKAVDFLAQLGLRTWKIASGEITNLPCLRKIGLMAQKVILSTGMSDLQEIQRALEVLEFAGTPRGMVVLLHCNSEYPTPMCDVNLRAMETLKSAFPGLMGVGYSDHTSGIEICIAACAMGAAVIEKHFTLDKKLPGPDHSLSVEPPVLAEMIRSIRNVELALGSGIKQPSASELKNIDKVRKSIVASRRIVAGEIFSEVNLTVKRPGTGISPMRWAEVIGKCAGRNYEKDDLVDA
jgi:N,N'-diacetyllegionaminate synthase